ncbi:unnamed protein product, partial [Iphiclides podalirius]
MLHLNLSTQLYLREYAPDEGPPREEWRRPEWGNRGRLPQVDRSPSRRSPYLARDEEPSPAPDERGRSASAGAHHRARPRPLRYQSLEREYDRSYAPPPEEEYYRREPPLFLGELQSQNSDLQRELGNLKKELELTNQKLGSSMHSIKTFWSPELKKERALRKEESAKYSLINDQLKLLNQENQFVQKQRRRIICLQACLRPLLNIGPSHRLPRSTILSHLHLDFPHI